MGSFAKIKLLRKFLNFTVFGMAALKKMYTLFFVKKASDFEQDIPQSHAAESGHSGSVVDCLTRD